jgi:hypothetical protein
VAKSKIETAAYALISDYTCLYKQRYGIPPIINKYKEKWAMISLVEDFGPESVSNTLEYYFKLNKDGHPLNWFYNNYSTIHSSRIESEKDEERRVKQREVTRKLREEYLNGIR